MTANKEQIIAMVHNHNYLKPRFVTIERLKSILETLNNIERLKVVILSDGNFNRDEYKEFIELKNKQKNLIMRTVAVGADADLLKLKKTLKTQ